jgi:hypothetical protein
MKAFGGCEEVNMRKIADCYQLMGMCGGEKAKEYLESSLEIRLKYLGD